MSYQSDVFISISKEGLSFKRASIFEVLKVYICNAMSRPGNGHHPNLGPGLCVRTEFQNKVILGVFNPS